MKITQAEVALVGLPMRFPKGLKGEVDPDWKMPVVYVKLRTDTGLEGLGHTVTLTPEFTQSLRTVTIELSTLLIGGDPTRPEELSRRMMYPANWIGPGGLINIAAAALDIAVWDLAGKAMQQPLWRLLGGFRQTIPVYDSGALFGPNIDELQEAAAASVEGGYAAMKMRPGPERFGSVSEVCARIAAIRDVIGYDVDLMYDVNQTWSVSRAIRACRAIEPYELAWIEDPTNMEDVAGQRQIRERGTVPICSGEYHYSLSSLARLVESQAVDYLMVDLLRVGGITPFRKIAGFAETVGIQIASHLIPEVYSQCIAAIPNGLIVEGIPWTEMLFDGAPGLVNGELELRDDPGHGLTIREDVARRYSLATPEIVS